MVRVYRSHRPVLAPFPEVPRLLARLRPRFRLGLLSDGYLAVQQGKLAALGLGGWFDAIVFSDQWGREAWKPSPRPFLAVLEALRVPAERAVYVADNPAKDFLGARRLGIYTARVRRPDGEYAGLTPPTEQHAPHITVGALGELPGALALRIA
jgi:putative hydrolase of the HAD superfamily